MYHYTALITVLAVLFYMFASMRVSWARGKYGVKLPATSGNADFERVFRVHMNTLEQLVVFLPALWIFASFVSSLWAAILGAIFIVGRAIYAVTYVKDPKKRSAGFALTALPELVLLIGILVWAVMALVKTPAAG